jgi:hypothetical protein
MANPDTPRLHARRLDRPALQRLRAFALDYLAI